MDANSMIFRHWEDVVFENRNRSYGAYLLRRAYANRLLSGVGITITLFVIILSLHNISGNKEGTTDVMPPLTQTGVILTYPPSFKKEEPRQRTARQPKTNTQNRRVVVTTEEVVDEREVEAIADYISTEGFEDGDVGTLEGIGTIPLAEPEPVIEPVFRDFAEVMPQYEGGLEAMMKFIQRKIRYPRAPQQLGIDGTVFVRFIVNGDGSVSDVEIIKGVHPDYDKEAMRVISMLPSWKGGSHNGRPVSVRMVLPIRFNLK